MKPACSAAAVCLLLAGLAQGQQVGPTGDWLKYEAVLRMVRQSTSSAARIVPDSDSLGRPMGLMRIPAKAITRSWGNRSLICGGNRIVGSERSDAVHLIVPE
jgi:hypothetical protein